MANDIRFFTAGCDVAAIGRNRCFSGFSVILGYMPVRVVGCSECRFLVSLNERGKNPLREAYSFNVHTAGTARK